LCVVLVYPLLDLIILHTDPVPGLHSTLFERGRLCIPVQDREGTFTSYSPAIASKNFCNSWFRVTNSGKGAIKGLFVPILIVTLFMLRKTRRAERRAALSFARRDMEERLHQSFLGIDKQLCKLISDRLVAHYGEWFDAKIAGKVDAFFDELRREYAHDKELAKATSTRMGGLIKESRARKNLAKKVAEDLRSILDDFGTLARPPTAAIAGAPAEPSPRADSRVKKRIMATLMRRFGRSAVGAQ